MANAAESGKTDPFLQEFAHKMCNPIPALDGAWTDDPTTIHGLFQFSMFLLWNSEMALLQFF